MITLRLSLLSSTAGAWPGRDRIIESCTRSVNSWRSLTSLISLSTNTTGELDHQFTHTVFTTVRHYHLFHWGHAMGH